MEYYMNTITKKRSIASIELDEGEYEAACTSSHSCLDALNTRLESVEVQNKVICDKLVHSEKKINRLSRSYSMGSINDSLLKRLKHRVELAEKQSNDIYDKMADTEHRIEAISPYIGRSAAGCSEVDELISRIDDIELTNNELREKLRNTQAKVGNLEQYSMKENIEIIGIPDSVRNSELEETVIKVLASINVNVKSSDIVVCHRLPKNSESGDKSGNVIVRFVDRKVSTDSLRKRKRLKKSPFNNIFNSTICIVENFTKRLSHLFKHREEKPRRVKAIYHVENTSTLPPDDVRKELERVLNLMVKTSVLSSFNNPERYLFRCKGTGDKKTVFELEVCLVPLMDNIVGIRRKRLKGDGWQYKEIVENILSNAKV